MNPKELNFHIFVELSSITKKGEIERSLFGFGNWVKALVWFWWIDETLSANLVYLSDYEIGGTFQVVSKDGDDQDGGVTMVIKCSVLEKKKEKNKRLKAKV